MLVCFQEIRYYLYIYFYLQQNTIQVNLRRSKSPLETYFEQVTNYRKITTLEKSNYF